MINETLVVGVNALARELRLSREWLGAEVAAGRLPHLRAGKRLLFNVEAVRHALAARAARTEEEGGSSE